ncbi:GntR family transcriptional regulator [Frondihabitans sucicola]|uniref:GntR family transcriptional regulator n=1 Tax=Frondihabitans sucicola TaxID=1268041 RepID=A0ABM8GTY9_9MICO|nr:GntR family transcriptional regulator [Frondihabitans sucicola]BDZ51918.1 GntR family transcriptional regulator [Frondihabitans sucicola]
MADDTNSRTLLRERIHGQILRAILDGTLKPGERLRDDELIAWLGTSRAPIREALTQLADLGVVEMSPNRFTKVAQISPRLYAESASVWATLVTRAMHWGILDFPPDQLPILEALNETLRTTQAKDFPPGPTPIDGFVGVIVQHCSNQVLLDSIRVHDPLLQLGVNRYKGFMKTEPIHLYFIELIRRCRDHDVTGFEAGMRAFLSGPMRAYTQEMTGFHGFSDYEGSHGAGSEQ